MRKIILPLALLISTLATRAQTEEMIVPGDLKQQTIVTEPATLRKGYCRTGLSVSLGVADKYFNGDSKKTYLPESVWTTDWSYRLIIQYGITDRLTGELWIPYGNKIWNYYQVYIDPVDNTDYESVWNQKGKGLADISLSARYQLLTESESRPSLTGTLDLSFPTGRKNPSDVKSTYEFTLPTGSGAFALTSELRLRKIIYPFSYVGYINYIYHFPGEKLINPGDVNESSFTDGNLVSAGISFNFHLNDWIAVANDASFSYWGRGKVENVSPDDLYTNWIVLYEARLVFQIRRIRLAEAATIPIKGKNFPADPQYGVIVQYIF
jgi:hypothetical protein